MVGVGAQGGCSLWVLIVGASSIWKTPPTCSGWEKVYIRHGPAFKLPDFSLQASSIVQSTAACSTTFRPDLPLPFLHHYNAITTVAVLQAATQLEVVRSRFRVRVIMCFYLSSCFCSPRLAYCGCLLYSCYSVVHVAPSQPNAYWCRRWCARLPLRFGEWSFASRTFYAITALLTVTRCEVVTVGRLSLCFLKIDDACSTSLPAEIAEATSSQPNNLEPNDDWIEEMARLVALTYGGESAPVPGCLCDGTGILYCLCSVPCSFR